MISKVKISGNHFSKICNYVCGDETRAKILSIQGVRENPKQMAEDFEFYRNGFDKRNVVFHGILSFAKDDKINDALLQKIAQLYLERLGLGDSAYSVTKHTDTQNTHMHIISSLISMDGKTIVNDSFIGLKAKRIAQAITLKFGLTPADNKHIEKINYKALKGKDLEKYKIFLIVNQVLPKCKSMEDLEKNLKEKNIMILYKIKSGTDQIQGISFKNTENGYLIKGSALDRRFSYNNLLYFFENKHHLVREMKIEHGHHLTKENVDQNQSANNEIPLYDSIFNPISRNTIHEPFDEELLFLKKKKSKKNSFNL